MPLEQPFPNTVWQASLLPASFRGVPFGVMSNRGGAGRRGRVHEYPFRNIPYTEDLGRRARRYSLNAFVLGDDAGAQRNAVITVCEQKGAGILIHPTLGVLLLQPDPDTEIEWEERWDEGRAIAIRLAFVEPGTLSYPTAAADTQAVSKTAADGIDASANADLGVGVSASGPGAGGIPEALPTADSADLTTASAPVVVTGAGTGNAGAGADAINAVNLNQVAGGQPAGPATIQILQDHQ